MPDKPIIANYKSTNNQSNLQPQAIAFEPTKTVVVNSVNLIFCSFSAQKCEILRFGESQYRNNRPRFSFNRLQKGVFICVFFRKRIKSKREEKMTKLFRQTSETTKLYIKVIFPTKIYNSLNRRIFSDARPSRKRRILKPQSKNV